MPVKPKKIPVETAEDTLYRVRFGGLDQEEVFAFSDPFPERLAHCV